HHRQQQRGDGEAAEESLQPDPAGRHQRILQGAEDVHLAGLEAALFRRNGHELATAINRLLHGKCRDQGFHAGQQIFRSKPLSQDDRLRSRFYQPLALTALPSVFSPTLRGLRSVRGLATYPTDGMTRYWRRKVRKPG